MSENEKLVERLGAVRELLAAQDARQEKLHDLLETIREQIRIGVASEQRPEGLFKNIQDAVYAMRGRMPLLNDAAITSPLTEAAAALTAAEARIKMLSEALEPFARIDTKGRSGDETVGIAVCVTREEAEAFNANIDARKLPIKKAGTDPYAPDAGMNWPKLVLDIDGIRIAAFNAARQALTGASDAG